MSNVFQWLFNTTIFCFSLSLPTLCTQIMYWWGKKEINHCFINKDWWNSLKKSHGDQTNRYWYDGQNLRVMHIGLLMGREIAYVLISSEFLPTQTKSPKLRPFAIVSLISTCRLQLLQKNNCWGERFDPWLWLLVVEINDEPSIGKEIAMGWVDCCSLNLGNRREDKVGDLG